MTAILSPTLRAEIGWKFSDTLTDGGVVVDASKTAFNKTLASGDSLDQANLVWHQQRVATAGANDDLDLTALSQSLFGGSVAFSFAAVKAIVIVCLSTTSGDKLQLDSSVTNGFIGPFAGSATSKAEIGADSAWLLSSAKDGWATASDHKVLRVHNPGASDVSYEIVVTGTTN